MISRAQEKLVRSLASRKGRATTGLCLLEGSKVIAAAGDAVVLRFGRADTADFDHLVTTETPQDEAAVARVPRWQRADLLGPSTLVVLDRVQDPGNVGAILRLCLGFGGALLLVEGADPTAPKVVRASAGALFAVPWLRMGADEAVAWLGSTGRPLFRLERGPAAGPLRQIGVRTPVVLVAGSEGRGIQLDVAGTSVAIDHDGRLESLNVGHAVAIALQHRFAACQATATADAATPACSAADPSGGR